jgi:2-oxoglutarate dehydrogenase E1 component
MTIWQEFHGPNAGYVLELYERFRQDPGSVDPETRRYFEQWTPPAAGDGGAFIPSNGRQAGDVSAATATFAKISGVVNLAEAIREYGHLAAQLDPLGTSPPGDPALDTVTHGLNDNDLRGLPARLVGGPLAETSSNALTAIQSLREVYSANTGFDFDHIRQPEERAWLRHAAESRQFRPEYDADQKRALLTRLTQVESFEHFLHRAFPGKTRFSIEGLDMMIPVLDELVDAAACEAIYTILIGMAHRGRLNVLTHILCKSYAEILAEFKDPLRPGSLTEELGWTGDVKYHAGGRYRRQTDETGAMLDLVITIAPNPSHLEHVNPVVQGMARAAGSMVDRPGPPAFDDHVSLPILIHGDTAFSGQGVVAETLNYARLPGYQTGGTIHIIANNQLGFTTEPAASFSTLYASDLAKGFKIPVIHVNADDPIACIEAAHIASAYQIRFKKDFLIDLIGYRRYGHNEGDEPSFTQPLLYQKINEHPTARQLWADHLVQEGSISAEEARQLVHDHMEEMARILASLQPDSALTELQLEAPPRGAAQRVDTAVAADTLRELNQALMAFPDDFNVNPKLERPLRRRRTALDEIDEAAIDWSTAEDLALASILADGIAIRFTGEDVERGTFSHRHAVFHDVNNGRRYTPLQSIPQAKAAFAIYNSPLTENAIIGFEYGYNIEAPDQLVIWEAQYGDFINTAQAMLDEFLVSGRAKWEQTPSLVLLLPHGYEGQGPDHSSGRLERFLQLAAETNLRIANCTTAGQYFHLLRRQALLLKTDPLPLIVMTPKSLLRHPRAASSLRDLAEGRWQPVIDDAEAQARAAKVRRLILCSGKVYVDLITHEQRQHSPAVAIARVEQLYRFPDNHLQAVFEKYPKLAEIAWLQEEPANMGAWEFVQPKLIELIDGRWPLRYLGRPRRASPAEGSMAWHRLNQKNIIEQAYAL